MPHFMPVVTISIPTRYVPAYTITFNETSIARGTTISVSFTLGSGYDSSAWIGIIPASVAHGPQTPADAVDLCYQYISNTSNGIATLNIPVDAALDTYDIRMYPSDNNSYDEVATSSTFEIVAPPVGYIANWEDGVPNNTGLLDLTGLCTGQSFVAQETGTIGSVTISIKSYLGETASVVCWLSSVGSNPDDSPVSGGLSDPITVTNPATNGTFTWSSNAPSVTADSSYVLWFGTAISDISSGAMIDLCDPYAPGSTPPSSTGQAYMGMGDFNMAYGEGSGLIPFTVST